MTSELPTESVLAMIARLTCAIGTVGVVLNGFEWAARFSTNVTFFDWELLQTRLPIAPSARAIRATRWFGSRPATAVVIGVGVFASCASAVLAPTGVPGGCAALLVLGAFAALHVRCTLGFDGSDQKQVMVWAGLAAYHFASSRTARCLALEFIGAQFLLSYLTAGLAKAVSPVWRSGRALGLILQTGTYGGGRFAALAAQRPAGLAMCWATMALEVAGPALLLLGPRGGVAFAAAALTFHVVIALAMGLNLFVWAFGAGLPCVVLISMRVQLIH